MLQDFQNMVNLTITVGDVVQNIFLAFLCGMLISVFYRLTYRGPGYQHSFLNSLVVLTMITSVVIMVIGNNLARAFGLVGAMSIIRFRTAVKETLDIIYIFFALAIGMAAGVGLAFIALASTISIGTILWFLTKSNLVAPPKKEFLLQFSFTFTQDAAESPYLEVIRKYCKSSKLINVKSVGKENDLELAYYVNIKNLKMNNEFIQELKSIEGVNHINLFFDEEQF